MAKRWGNQEIQPGTLLLVRSAQGARFLPTIEAVNETFKVDKDSIVLYLNIERKEARMIPRIILVSFLFGDRKVYKCFIDSCHAQAWIKTNFSPFEKTLNVSDQISQNSSPALVSRSNE